jgi:hypothetical protein
VAHLWKTDFDAIEGDSGGPYFVGNDYYGVHADSISGIDPPEEGNSWYTTIARAESVGGLDVCLDSNC